jgi:hypothetical protein
MTVQPRNRGAGGLSRLLCVLMLLCILFFVPFKFCYSAFSFSRWKVEPCAQVAELDARVRVMVEPREYSSLRHRHALRTLVYWFRFL